MFRILKLQKIFLLSGDYLFMLLSLFLALQIRYIMTGRDLYLWGYHDTLFYVIFAGWVIIFYLFDLYDLKKIKTVTYVMANVAMAVASSFVITIVFFYLFPTVITPKTTLVIVAVLVFLFITLWRIVWVKTITRKVKLRVLMVGADSLPRAVIEELEQPVEAQYEIVGFVSVGQEGALPLEGRQVVGHYTNLPELIKINRIDEVVVAFKYYDYPEVTHKLTECMGMPIRIIDLPLFYEEATGKVPVEHIDHVWLLSQLNSRQSLFDIVERFSDVLVSSLGLVVSLPLAPLLIAAIKLDSKGPVIYSQVRTGLRGKPFTVYKFRSMVQDAEKRSGAVWAAQNDARVTRVGAFMRKTRLDEIPQLWNVLRGDMSMVGPRPERPVFIEAFKTEIPHYTHRHIVKPGLTGWAQVKYGYTSSAEETLEKLQYDLYYIKNRSLILYLVIIVRTIRIILTRKGV